MTHLVLELGSVAVRGLVGAQAPEMAQAQARGLAQAEEVLHLYSMHYYQQALEYDHGHVSVIIKPHPCDDLPQPYDGHTPLCCYSNLPQHATSNKYAAMAGCVFHLRQHFSSISYIHHKQIW